MSSTTDSPAGSFWSIMGTAILHGCSIVFLLIAASLMGWIDQLDALLNAWLSGLMSEDFPKALPQSVNWLMTIGIAFGLPLLILSCSHGWQRLTLWLTSIALLALWAPVLCLAAHRPAISLSWLAALMVGVLVALQLYWNARKPPNS